MELTVSSPLKCCIAAECDNLPGGGGCRHALAHRGAAWMADITVTAVVSNNRQNRLLLRPAVVMFAIDEHAAARRTVIPINEDVQDVTSTGSRDINRMTL